jgi:hypothetical protein
MARYAATSTALNLAKCYEHDGKVATAWAMYKRALVLNRETQGKDRQKAFETLAQKGVDDLERRLPKLRVTVVDPPQAMSVEEGGRALPVDVPVPLDPGPHDVVISAPNRVTVRRNVTLREGESTTVDVALLPAAEPPRPVGPATQAPAPPRPSHDAAATSSAGGAAIPLWAWVLGGTGLALAGVSVAFSFDAKSASDDLRRRCGSDLVCNENPDYDPTDENARKNRDIGLAIGFGAAGVVALTAGILGIVTSRSAGRPPRSVRIVRWVSVSNSGAALGARW